MKSTVLNISFRLIDCILFWDTQNHFIATASTQFSPFQKPFFASKNSVKTFAQHVQWGLKSFYYFEVIYFYIYIVINICELYDIHMETCIWTVLKHVQSTNNIYMIFYYVYCCSFPWKMHYNLLTISDIMH